MQNCMSQKVRFSLTRNVTSRNYGAPARSRGERKKIHKPIQVVLSGVQTFNSGVIFYIKNIGKK